MSSALIKRVWLWTPQSKDKHYRRLGRLLTEETTRKTTGKTTRKTVGKTTGQMGNGEAVSRLWLYRVEIRWRREHTHVTTSWPFRKETFCLPIASRRKAERTRLGGWSQTVGLSSLKLFMLAWPSGGRLTVFREAKKKIPLRFSQFLSRVLLSFVIMVENLMKKSWFVGIHQRTNFTQLSIMQDSDKLQLSRHDVSSPINRTTWPSRNQKANTENTRNMN